VRDLYPAEVTDLHALVSPMLLGIDWMDPQYPSTGSATTRCGGPPA
jgi:hypothetical protein